MSIPKEPRQLMINIMYLVLTALLALNVSAEVFNAFKLVDKGLEKSNVSLDQANGSMPAIIAKGAKAKSSYQTYADRVDPIRELSSEMNDYLAGIKTTLISESGDYVLEGPDKGEYVGKKNFDVTTRLLVGEPQADGSVTGMGEEIKAKLLEYKTKMLQFVDEEDREETEKEFAIAIDDESWQTKGKASWSHFNFDHMPVAAVIPLFTKYQNDVKSTEATALNYLSGKVGTSETVVLNKFTVVSAPEKSYVIKGEQYKSDVFLSAFAGGDSKTKISISVNGQKLPTDKDGKAVYKETASTLGKKTLNAKANVFNPVTGQTKTYTGQFSYEVGERSGTISASKMNVFYIGVPNPVEVAIAGVNSNNIKVNMTGGSISRSGGSWVATVNSPGKAVVTASADGFTKSADFRVKRIPDPVPKLSKSRGGGMGSGEFKIQPGVFPVLENFDFDAKCNIAGYRVVRVPKRQDPQVSENPGGKFNGGTQALIKKAVPGDKYFFENIKCKCPGDGAARDLGGMVFNIK